MDEKLKACPFCGSTDVRFQQGYGDNLDSYVCGNLDCLAKGPPQTWKNPGEIGYQSAKDQWNKRAGNIPSRQMVERIAHLCRKQIIVGLNASREEFADAFKTQYMTIDKIMDELKK